MNGTITNSSAKEDLYSLIMPGVALLLITVVGFMFFFINQTLLEVLNSGLDTGLEMTERQYKERELNLAREGASLIASVISHEAEISPLPEEGLKEQILDKVRSGEDGVFTACGIFIFDESNTCLVSKDFPFVDSMNSEEIWEKYAVDFTTIFAELRKNGVPRLTSYAVESDQNSDEELIKYVYLSYIEKWDWIVGAGFFLQGVDRTLAEQLRLWQDVESSMNRRVVRKMAAASLFVLMIIVGACLLLHRSVLSRKKLNFRFRYFEKALEDNLCVMFCDTRGIITRVNEKYCSITGRSEDSLLGKRALTLELSVFTEEQLKELDDLLTKGEAWQGLVKGKDRGGANFWLQTQIGPVRDGNGSISGYVGYSLDVSDMYRKQYELEKSFYKDTLTGLGNRPRLLADYQRESLFYAAMYNIDNFSSINRFYGMDRGDEVLKRAARTLNSMLDPGKDTLYRIYGDTFVILSREPDRDTFVRRNRERWERLQKITVEFKEALIPLSFRLGLSSCRRDSLIVAESALIAAKSHSDGFVHYSDSELGRPLIEMADLENLNNIRLSLNRSDLFLVYQPIMNLEKGIINKYECLVRMRDGNGIVLNPGNFINLAKKGRLYKKITHQVIEKSFSAFQNRKEEFSINLTIEDFIDRETIAYLKERAAYYNISDRLIVEIVETEELRNFQEIDHIISSLKQKGIRIAIDDFGSGFSNFNYLLQLNADFIKIDGSLIKDILTDRKSRSLVASIIQFAKTSGIATIAEYIENGEIAEYAREAGISYGQGYHIGKPDTILPEEDQSDASAIDWMTEKRAISS